MTTSSLEDIRVFSQLTGKIHYIDIGQEKYACIGGVAMPYNLAIAFVIWAMTRDSRYQHIFHKSDQVDYLAKLNPHDPKMAGKPSEVLHYIKNKIINIMQTWSEAEFDELVPYLSTV